MTDLGRFIDFEDGRRFRYCKCNGSAGITIAYLCAAPTYVDNHVAQAQTSAIAAGSKDNISVVVTTTTPTANQYADGLLVVNSGDGKGQSYRIKKNTAANPTKIWLYDEIITALSVGDDITLIPNKYLNVVAAPTGMPSTPIGVPLITITAKYYFWAQTRGYVGMMADGSTAPTKGDLVMQSGTEGLVTVASGGVTPEIGVCIYAPATSEYCVVDLHLE